MRKVISLVFILLFVSGPRLFSQAVNLEDRSLEAVNVYYERETVKKKASLKVTKDPSIVQVDEPTFIKIKDHHFTNGTIEVKVLSRVLPNASDSARGFIGIAFRINDDNTKFENIYIRPTNGRAENQLRRNRSIQYFSYPDYKFDRTRKETPGLYESYADMGLDEWIKLKIVVKGNKARLFINDARHPSLIVNDLKHGSNASGSIGLWVDVGTEGYFTDLKISKEN